MNEIGKLEKRLKMVTAGMCYAMNKDRRLAGDTVAELWMIPLEAFPDDDDVQLFRKVSEYVSYNYGEIDEPAWLQVLSFAEDW